MSKCKPMVMLVLASVVMCCVSVIVGVAHADDNITLNNIARGIRLLQPTTDADRSTELSEVFLNAGKRNKLDPLLLVAISFRESSLLPSVENRRKLGTLGEYGLMQTHGAAINFRPVDCNHHLLPVDGPMGKNASKAYCQVETGSAYLSHARKQCGGTWSRWIAAYGMGQCPTDRYAKTTRGVQRAYKYYKHIGGNNWQ